MRKVFNRLLTIICNNIYSLIGDKECNVEELVNNICKYQYIRRTYSVKVICGQN